MDKETQEKFDALEQKIKSLEARVELIAKHSGALKSMKEAFTIPDEIKRAAERDKH